MEEMLWDKVISAIKNAIRRPMFRQINCLHLLTLYILTRVAIAVNFWNCIPCFDCGSTETYEHPFQKSPKMVAGLICTGCKRTWSLHLLLLSRQDITTEHRSTTCTYRSNVKLLASIARKYTMAGPCSCDIPWSAGSTINSHPENSSTLPAQSFH